MQKSTLTKLVSLLTMANHTPLEAEIAPVESSPESSEKLTAGNPEISQLLDERQSEITPPPFSENDVTELDFSIDDVFGGKDGDATDKPVAEKPEKEEPGAEVPALEDFSPDSKVESEPDQLLPSINGSFTSETAPDGTVTESHRGDGPNYNFELKEIPGGDLELTEEDGTELRFSENPELAEGRTDLLEKATLAIEDPAELARFKADMIRFENRGDLSPEEMQATYREVGRLFDENPDAKVDADGRATLAGQVMRLAADPTLVDQGKHNTCTVASVEARLYTRNPSKVAGLVADVAHDGTFTTSRGKDVEIPEGNFVPDEEAAKEPTADGERSFASQLFQTTMVNAVHQELRPGTFFEQVASEGPGDVGERLYSFIDGVKALNQNAPDMDDEKKALAYELITGENVDAVALNHSYEDPNQETGQFRTEDELRDYLSALKEEGQLPAMLSVVPGSGSFAIPGYSSFYGKHAVLVTDFDATTDEVRVDNQWGSERDRVDEPISMTELFASTLPVEQGWEHRLGAKVDAEFPDISENERRTRMLSERVELSSPAELHNIGVSVGSIMEINDRDFLDGIIEPDAFLEQLDLHAEIFNKLPPDEQLRALAARQSYSRSTPILFPEKFNSLAETGFQSAITASGLQRTDVESELSAVLTGSESDGSYKANRTMRHAVDFLAALPEAERERFLAMIN